nr:MAG TPA: hypothetical protein [Microviridae sp.]
MKHRQFKTECICVVNLGKSTIVCSNLKEAKNKIYERGLRNVTYEVNVVEKNTGVINDTYHLRYTDSGIIFQKQVYSRWKEELAKAKRQQLTIITLL